MTCKLSCVAPCFDEEAVLGAFYRRVSAAALVSVGDDYEIILVDDGSSDKTWSLIEALSLKDRHVLGVRLARNHGHQLAVTAGLSVASGARVLLIDADLQDPPELLPQMMRLMDDGADVVYGQRESRRGETAFKRASAFLFYRLLGALTKVEIPRDTGDFRLMSRSVVEMLNAMPERHRFVRGMVSWIGGVQVPLPYERDARFAGETKYPLRRMLSFAIDAITSFSTTPLRMAVWLGVSIAGFAFLVLFYALYQWAAGHVVPGWTSTLIANSFFSGTQLVVLGVIGEYLGRVVEEVKGRPLYSIGSVRRGERTMGLPAEFSRLPRPEQYALIASLAPSSRSVDRAGEPGLARVSAPGQRKRAKRPEGRPAPSSGLA